MMGRSNAIDLKSTTRAGAPGVAGAAKPVERDAQLSPQHELEAPDRGRQAGLPRNESSIAGDDGHALVAIWRDQVEWGEENEVAGYQIEGHPEARRRTRA